MTAFSTQNHKPFHYIRITPERPCLPGVYTANSKNYQIILLKVSPCANTR